MKYLVFALLLATQVQGNRPPRPEPWYERVLDEINPADIDYGAILEERKRAFIDRYLVNAYFQYSVWTTVAVIFFIVLRYVEKVSHERSMEIALRSLDDVRRHDEYARQVAREAIQRYNERIEACNRIIEAGESGTSELEALRQEHRKTLGELAASRKEAKDLGTLAEERSARIAELLQTPANKPQKKKRPPKHPAPPEHVRQINKLERDLSAEREKNRRAKGTRLDVGDR